VVGQVYRAISGCRFGPSEFSVGGKEYRIADVKSVDLEKGTQVGMLGFAFAMTGALGFLDGEFRVAFLAVPVGFAVAYLDQRLGPKTIRIRFSERKRGAAAVLGSTDGLIHQG
jgi:hypothetical protein